jgi:hypothetical protein
MPVKAEWTSFDVENRRFHQHSSGIVAEFSEVVIWPQGSLNDVAPSVPGRRKESKVSLRCTQKRWTAR